MHMLAAVGTCSGVGLLAAMGPAGRGCMQRELFGAKTSGATPRLCSAGGAVEQQYVHVSLSWEESSAAGHGMRALLLTCAELNWSDCPGTATALSPPAMQTSIPDATPNSDPVFFLSCRGSCCWEH